MRSSSLRHPARLAGASLLRLQSDERLAEMAIDGHEAAFDAIVVRYRTAIQRYCAGIVGPSRAEDATQQTLINAHDALKRTDEVRHLRSWLYRIAHNVSLNVLRAVRDDVPLDAVTAGDAVARSGDTEPVEAFERSERFRATVAALQQLPDRQRAALVLRELEGRSHEEIADALGVTKGSARQHVMRARVAVRGVVTAITPYPVIVRFSEMVAGAGGGAGWSEAATGAGIGATLTKLTAGVVATGALVGGAVGTREVVHRPESAAPRAAETAGAAAKPRAAAVRAPSAASAAPVVAVSDPATSASPAGASGRDHHASRTTHRKPSSSGGGYAPAPQHRPRQDGDDSGSSPSSSGHGRRSDHGDDSDDDHGGTRDGERSGTGGSSGSGRQGTSAGRDGSDDQAAADKQREDELEHASTDSSGGSDDRSSSGGGGSSTTETPSAESGSGSSGSGSSGSGGSDDATRAVTTPPMTTPTVTAPTDVPAAAPSGSDRE
jgi:RNA polymerase sigma factor (sigma-70 family)